MVATVQSWPLLQVTQSHFSAYAFRSLLAPRYLAPSARGLQTENQQLAFLPPQKDWTKVILCTNVARMSITIPDCTIVVDTCKEKQSSFDPTNRMPLLLEQCASRDSLKQRRSRAGRGENIHCLTTYNARSLLNPSHSVYCLFTFRQDCLEDAVSSCFQCYF